VGDSGVGKTCVLARFARNKFLPESKTTIGVEFATRTVQLDDKVVKLQVWDTAGQERYRAVTTSYYKGAVGALCVYDITSSVTFTNLGRWVAELRENSGPDIAIVLVGNKKDQRELRSVSLEEGNEYAQREGMLFLETSALDGSNIGEVFETLILAVIDKIESDKASALAKAAAAAPRPGAAVTQGSTSSGCC
jgi:small GTP-binding protein